MNYPTAPLRLSHGFQFREPPISFEFNKQNIIVGSTSGSPGGALWLGRLAEYQRMDINVWLDLLGAHAIYVMGKRRSGKTFTLGALLEGLLGLDGFSTGAQDQAVVVLDTMNVFLTSHTPAALLDADTLRDWGLPDVDNVPVDLFYPAGSAPPPDGINAAPFSVPAYAFTLEDWCDLFGLDPFADPMAQLLGDAIERSASSGFTVDGASFGPERYDIDALVFCVSRADELALYDPATRTALSRRLLALGRTGLFGREEATFLTPNRASVFLLRDIDPELRRLLVTYLSSRILRDRSGTESLERVLPTIRASGQRTEEVEKRIAEGTPRTWLIIDEAHNYIPSVGGGQCRKVLNRYVTEGRNLGLSIVVATQHPSALDPALKRNADVLLIHTLTMGEDIDVAANMLTTSIPESIILDNTDLSSRRAGRFAEAVRRLPRGYCFLSSDSVDRLVPVAVRPRVTYHGGAGY